MKRPRLKVDLTPVTIEIMARNALERLPALDVCVTSEVAREAERQGFYHFEPVEPGLRSRLHITPLATEAQVKIERNGEKQLSKLINFLCPV